MSAVKRGAEDVILHRALERVGDAEFFDRLFGKFDAAFNRGRARAWLSWDNVEKEFQSALSKARKYLDLYDGDDCNKICGQRVLSSHARQKLEEELDNKSRDEFAWAQQRKVMHGCSLHSALPVQCVTFF